MTFHVQDRRDYSVRATVPIQAWIFPLVLAIPITIGIVYLIIKK